MGIIRMISPFCYTKEKGIENMVSLLNLRAGLIVVAGTIAFFCSPKFRNKVFKASKQISDTLFMNDNIKNPPPSVIVDRLRQR